MNLGKMRMQGRATEVPSWTVCSNGLGGARKVHCTVVCTVSSVVCIEGGAEAAHYGFSSESGRGLYFCGEGCLMTLRCSGREVEI